MYVQFQIPARRFGAGWPVIMVHGSSHTGACLESTPDGREGWYPYFVRKGVSELRRRSGRARTLRVRRVCDPRGRSQDRRRRRRGGGGLIPGFGRITDDGAWTNWFGHLVPANSTILTGTLFRTATPRIPTPTRTLRARRAAVPARRRGPEHGRRVTGPSGRRRPDRRGRMRSSTTSSWCPTRRSRSRAPSARPAIRRDLAGQYLDAAEPGGARRTARRRDRRRPTRSRASWDTT